MSAKPTEDDTRQVRSIDDQIRDCQKLAKELGLHVVEVIREQKSAKMQGLQGDIDKLQEQITDPEQDIMSFEEFLNIVNNAGKLLRAADVGLKDRIARLIYLNVRVDSEKVVDYQMREPFKTYFKTHKILDGRGDRT